MALGFLPTTALVRKNLWMLRTTRHTQRLIMCRTRTYKTISTYPFGVFTIEIWTAEWRTKPKCFIVHGTNVSECTIRISGSTCTFGIYGIFNPLLKMIILLWIKEVGQQGVPAIGSVLRTNWYSWSRSMSKVKNVWMTTGRRFLI